jgi:hypothetical protein
VSVVSSLVFQINVLNPNKSSVVSALDLEVNVFGATVLKTLDFTTIVGGKPTIVASLDLATRVGQGGIVAHLNVQTNVKPYLGNPTHRGTYLGAIPLNGRARKVFT